MHKLMIVTLALFLSGLSSAASNILLPDQLSCHYILREYTSSDDAALTLDLSTNSITYFRYQRDRSLYANSQTSIRQINPANYLSERQLKDLSYSLQNNSIGFDIYHLQNGRGDKIEVLHIQSTPEMYFLTSNHPYSVRHARVAICKEGLLQ